MYRTLYINNLMEKQTTPKIPHYRKKHPNKKSHLYSELFSTSALIHFPEKEITPGFFEQPRKKRNYLIVVVNAHSGRSIVNPNAHITSVNSRIVNTATPSRFSAHPAFTISLISTYSVL